jgi:hypothetical protein
MFSWSPHALQDIWAAMLEDKKWMDDFMRKKIALMQQNYHTATTFLRRRGLKYFGAYVLIWGNPSVYDTNNNQVCRFIRLGRYPSFDEWRRPIVRNDKQGFKWPTEY